MKTQDKNIWNLRNLILVLGFVIQNSSLLAQSSSQAFEFERAMRMMFYNCENLFDTENDSLTKDDDFTPEGNYRWSYDKYNKKLQSISKVVMGIGDWELPEIIGICEIENRKVLEDLTQKTPLYKGNYRIVHFSSPDARGIDVACLFREDKLKFISSKPIRITFPFNTLRKTRDILYVQLSDNKIDTLHIFINHFPSRLGGQMASESNRLYVAQMLRNEIDTLQKYYTNPKIIITGDFNDYPSDKSLKNILQAHLSFDTIQTRNLYNLAYPISQYHKLGSHKHETAWGFLDQFIVSGALINSTSGIYLTSQSMYLYDNEMLLEPDEKNVGYRNNRTYIGMQYHGGYGDHLPIFIDFQRR